jgi:hypothetical protein
VRGPGALQLVTGDDVQRHSVVHSGWYVRPDSAKPAKFKKPEVYRPPKLLIRFVAQSLIAAVDEVGFYNTNVLYNVHSDEDPYYLAALLNSRLLDWWFRLTFQGEEALFPHVQKSQLMRVPIVRLHPRIEARAALCASAPLREMRLNHLRQRRGGAEVDREFATLLGGAKARIEQAQRVGDAGEALPFVLEVLPDCAAIAHALFVFLGRQMAKLGRRVRDSREGSSRQKKIRTQRTVAERIIDHIVYRLYGLSSRDIQTVEVG